MLFGLQSPLLQIHRASLFHLDVRAQKGESWPLSLLPQTLEHPFEGPEPLYHLLVVAAALLVGAGLHLATHHHMDPHPHAIFAGSAEQTLVLPHKIEVPLAFRPGPKVSGFESSPLLVLCDLSRVEIDQKWLLKVHQAQQSLTLVRFWLECLLFSRRKGLSFRQYFQ
jgi:hypothetical protein